MKMKEYKNYRIKCPLCGLLSWTSRLNENYNLQIYEQKLNRWTKSLEIIPVEIGDHFKESFREHFLNVLLNLMQHELIDIKYIREMVGLIERKEVTYPKSYSFEKSLSVSVEKPLSFEKKLEVKL